MQTIRLALTKNLEEVFDFLEKEYQPLSRAEILKLALAKLYKNQKQKISMVSEEEEKEIAKSLAQIKEGKFITIKNPKEIDSKLNKAFKDSDV